MTSHALGFVRELSVCLRLDSECTILSVEPESPAARAGLPPHGGRWAVTEVNNRQINLLKGGEEEMNRLASCGKEVSVLVQPAPLVKRLRAALRANRSLLGS
ncbi:hypothetical protein EVAR_60478_1 [Eumeta japonica]|uniref:PDZ domain-containing protein n=1 Tax=Eumeta variegata TaxID=151549 RepID=A0A4C2A571_EUMVA|nr:hypothetical protein EVAR_60478_1 [Eumeta japonica]